VSEWIWDDDLPLIPGSDVAGVVESTGTDGSEFSVGDRVFGTVPMTNVTGSRGDRQGVVAERATVRTDRLAPLPDEVPFVQGATAGVVVGTVWRALRELADLPPGGSALIHGGSGCVGHVAVQLASGWARTCSLLHIPTMIETYCDMDVDVVAMGGDIPVIGNNYDQPQVTDLTTAIGKDLTIQPFDTFNLDPIDGTLARIGQLMAAGELSIEVARRYDLDETGQAQRAVMEDSFVGKVAVVP
jgi:NADPH:quinone reductase-like Zn-dependent oxidoreductase